MSALKVGMPIASLFLVLAGGSWAQVPPASYTPALPPGLAKGLVPIVNLGLSGHSLARPPVGVVAIPPSARDSITYPTTSPGIATVKVANNPAYQSQDMRGGHATSELKTRAEFSTMDLGSTAYGEGDSRVYRVAVRLHPDWHWDDLIAIFAQLKRMSAGPDLFLAVKRHEIVLRIGRSGEANSSQTVVAKEIAPGKWIEIVLVVKWSASNQGLVSTFYRYSDENGYHLIKDVPGKNLQDPSRKSYVKFGIYKPENFPPGTPTSAAQSLDFANVTVFAAPK